MNAARLREERAGDEAVIAALASAAFEGVPYSDGTEAAIIDALRKAGALTLSLVAEDERGICGHAAFSPVRISGEGAGWYGLGPVSVAPERQGAGIGGALIREGLTRLREMGAAGCVVLGDPGYYPRFGFQADPALRYAGAPAEYFMALNFTGAEASGEVTYHPGFGGG